MLTALAAVIYFGASPGQIKDPSLIKPASEAKSIAAFLHQSNKLNTSGNVTRLDNPALNGNPNAVLIVTRTGRLQDDTPAVGVWYSNDRWTIFTQDRSPLPLGQRFVVEAFEPGPYAFVQTSKGAASHLEPLNPAIPAEKGMGLFATAAYTNTAIYNTHPIGTWHDGAKWNVFQADRLPIDAGAAFHVVYAKAAALGSAETELGSEFAIELASLKGTPESLISMCPGYSSATGAYVENAFSSVWSPNGWLAASSPDEDFPQGAFFYIRESGRLPLTAVNTLSATLTQTAKFRLSFVGFKVIKESADDLLETDGKGDELYFHIDTSKGTSKSSGALGEQFTTRFYGDINRPDNQQWIQAGSRSDKGGLKTGDTYPNPLALLPMSGTSGVLPFVVWEGEIRAEDTGIAIVPTAWEKDGNQASFLRHVKRRPASLVFDGDLSQLVAFTHSLSYPGGFNGDAPIGWSTLRFSARLRNGARTVVKRTGFAPKRILLNFANASSAVTAQGPLGQGTFVVEQGLPTANSGSCQMFFRIERI